MDALSYSVAVSCSGTVKKGGVPVQSSKNEEECAQLVIAILHIHYGV